MSNKYLQQATGAFQTIGPTDLTGALQTYTSVLAGNTSSTSTSVWTTIGSVTQGTSGTWLCLGFCVTTCISATHTFMQITDGVTVYGSGVALIALSGANAGGVCVGIATSPTTNIKFQFHPGNEISVVAEANFTGGAKDSGLTVVRIG